MLHPQVVAPRGIYESCYYYLTVGTIVLYSITSHGILHRKRAVCSPEEYQQGLIELTADLDAFDPLPPLALMD